MEIFTIVGIITCGLAATIAIPLIVASLVLGLIEIFQKWMY